MTLPDPNTPGTYVRHRQRMVRQSIFEDLRDTLIRTQWMAGTTRDNAVTTAPGATIPLLGGHPINLIDFFPERNSPISESTPINTFAMDVGVAGTLGEGEMGGHYEQPYQFNFALYANSDATAVAMFSDLYDRYIGISDSPYVTLYNYLVDPPTPVVRMEVDDFGYMRDTERPAPAEVFLYVAQLEITDYVDQVRNG